jgi:PQQ-like domain
MRPLQTIVVQSLRDRIFIVVQSLRDWLFAVGQSLRDWLFIAEPVSALLFVCLLPLTQAAESQDLALQDEKTLQEAKVPTDGAGLLTYLRKQTPGEGDLARLAQAVRLLGARSYAVREKAQSELERAGPPALRFLRAALASPDLEVARRAERAIQQIERIPHGSLMASVVRVLGKRGPEGTVESLLAYLPSANEEAVEQAILDVLVEAGVRKGKVHPALVAALKDPQAPRRAAAVYVHARAVPARLEAIRPLVTDADPAVRFRAAEGLVRGRDPAGVSILIALLEGAPARLGWRVEELLYRIAGEAAPIASLGTGDEETRRHCREAWEGWWKKNAARVKLAKVDFEDPTLGVTLYCEYDGAAGGGRVWLAGPDGKLRWEITGLLGPNDARLLPGGRVLIAERNGNRVTERDSSGKVLWKQDLGTGALSAERLPGGNTLVACWNKVASITPDHGTAWSYMHPSGFRHASRLRNGHIAGVASNGQVLELDAAGKLLRTVTPEKYGGGAGYWASVEQVIGGRFLVAFGTSGKVGEIDGTGKVVWEGDVPNAVFVTRLRNGNTMACNFEGRQVIELNRAGKVVSTQTLSGRPFTARRY